jgi:hypothetical protein
MDYVRGRRGKANKPQLRILFLPIKEKLFQGCWHMQLGMKKINKYFMMSVLTWSDYIWVIIRNTLPIYVRVPVLCKTTTPNSKLLTFYQIVNHFSFYRFRVFTMQLGTFKKINSSKSQNALQFIATVILRKSYARKTIEKSNTSPKSNNTI